MKLTVSTNVKRQSFATASGLIKHDEHDPQHGHSNETIVNDGSYGVVELMQPCLRKVVEQVYKQFVDDRNARIDNLLADDKITVTQAEHRWRTLDEWLAEGRQRSKDAKDGKPIVSSLVVTIGNKDDLPYLFQMLGIDYKMQEWPGLNGDQRAVITNDEDKQRWKDYMTAVFSQVLDDYKAHAGFVPYKATIHLDEGGAPHMHLGLVNAGHTPNGGQSYTLNKAINDWLGDHSKKPNSVVNLKRWRKQADQIVTNAMTAVNKDWKVEENVDLMRTNPALQGLPMDTYKALETYKHQEAELIDKLADLTVKHHDLKQETEELTSTNEDLKQSNAELTAEIGRKQAIMIDWDDLDDWDHASDLVAFYRRYLPLIKRARQRYQQTYANSFLSPQDKENQFIQCVKDELHNEPVPKLTTTNKYGEWQLPKDDGLSL